MKNKFGFLALLVVLVLAAVVVMNFKALFFDGFTAEDNGDSEEPQEPDRLPDDPDEIEEEPAPELIAQVRAAGELYHALPVDAVYNSTYNTVIPELNGYRLDQQATLEKLSAQAPGSEVAPVWAEVLPDIKSADYPAAVIEKGNPARQKVAFMVNVAWGNEYLAEMLAAFEQYSVKTTFFIAGRWAEKYGDLLQEIHEHGHELANHGYDDGEMMSDLDYDAAAESLRKTNEAIRLFTGESPLYFTPHAGDYNSTTCQAAADLGMRLLLWTLDTVDWQRPGEEVMAKRILDNLVPGAIILMHPTEQSAGFLHHVLPEIQSRDYSVVTIAELLSSAPDYPQIVFKS